MKKTLTKSFKQIALGQVCAALTLTAALFTVSCEQPTNSVRSESIEVYVDLDEKEPVDAACVHVVGGLHQIYVKSNVAYTASWEDGETSPWATIVSDEVDPSTGLHVITLSVKRRSTGPYYTRRTGTLILQANNEGLNFNKYVQIHQGATARVSSDFSWLNYGDADPRIEDGAVSATNWNSSQKDRDWTSTLIPGESIVHFYGKKGYAQLGDDKGHGADFYSPHAGDVRYDSLLMVSFRAVSHVDHKTGAKDNNKFTVEVVGGGVIADFAEANKTSIDLEAKHMDPKSETFPSDMWDGSEFMVFVLSTEDNPLTVNTRIRIKCGSLEAPASTNSRLYIDNFYIRRVTEIDEPYYEQNGGSGVDKVMGAQEEEEVVE